MQDELERTGSPISKYTRNWHSNMSNDFLWKQNGTPGALSQYMNWVNLECKSDALQLL
jgi:hypothetical protein